ncbi:MAG: CBS domain-containing protein [Betaproteobacteria bacterium]|nr:CBS domain-containing protein [Betaproteobacteria bacterium]
MLARDVMTTAILTVTPETDVGEIARTMLDAHISAIPVIADDGSLVGIVSEGDLIHRAEAETRRRPSWWLRLLATPEEPAERYLREFGRRARDVMTKDVITVGPDTPLTEIASMLEKYHIKRVPVLEGNRLVGIVSRANLLRGVATWQKPTGVRVEDTALRALLLDALAEAELPMHLVNVTVTAGVVEIWGVVDSALQVEAARAAAEATAGVVRLESHLVCRA